MPATVDKLNVKSALAAALSNYKQQVKAAASKPSLSRFPRPIWPSPLSWIRAIGEDLWDSTGIREMLETMSTIECEKLKISPPLDMGWRRLVDRRWEAVTVEALPDCMFVDVESEQVDGRWVAILCVAYTADGWYCWQGRGIIPSRLGCVMIGHNASQHDSQFFESEYTPASPDKNVWIDTMAMAEMLRGVMPDRRAEFEKFKGMGKKGKGAPAWVATACDVGLDDALMSFCGIAINKSVNGSLFAGEAAPETFFEYCCQDVWATVKLFQAVYPMLRKRSGAWWYGQTAVTGLRVDVPEWESAIADLALDYEAAKSISPTNRSEFEANLVKWGKSHLSRFSDATIVGGVMPLRVKPANVFGQHCSDWTKWVGHNWDELGAAMPMLRLAENNIPDAIEWEPNAPEDIVVLDFTLPQCEITESIAQVKGRKARAETFLGATYPESITDVEGKAKWFVAASQADVLAMFTTVMDAFIIEKDLTAWLSIPGSTNASFCVREDQAETLMAWAEEVINAIELVVKNA